MPKIKVYLDNCTYNRPFESGCQCFITTDKSLLRKTGLISEIEIINPIDFIRKKEETDGSCD